MPSTVPNSPMNGVTDAVVASQLMLRSSLASSSLMPSCSVRSSASRLVQRAARLSPAAPLLRSRNRRPPPAATGGTARSPPSRLPGRWLCGTRAGTATLAAARARGTPPLGKDDGPGERSKRQIRIASTPYPSGLVRLDHLPEISLQEEGNGSRRRSIRLLILKSNIETRALSKKTVYGIQDLRSSTTARTARPRYNRLECCWSWWSRTTRWSSGCASVFIPA